MHDCDWFFGANTSCYSYSDRWLFLYVRFPLESFIVSFLFILIVYLELCFMFFLFILIVQLDQLHKLEECSTCESAYKQSIQIISHFSPQITKSKKTRFGTLPGKLSPYLSYFLVVWHWNSWFSFITNVLAKLQEE